MALRILVGALYVFGMQYVRKGSIRQFLISRAQWCDQLIGRFQDLAVNMFHTTQLNR